MGSVKELEVEEPAGSEDLGRGVFHFTDDYSVFDWGKMPDEIPGKGRSLCTMGAFNFELLESEGVSTHYRGVLEDGDVSELSDAVDAPRKMEVDLAQVPDLPHSDDGYDYSAFHAAAGSCYLVPLEVVFRNSVPVGSSLRSRRTPEEVGLDLDSWPEEHVELREPVIEYSTKFEEKDRYLSEGEAREISGLDDLTPLEEVARDVNRVVTGRAGEVEFTHLDGKIECFYHDGEVMVADVAGTFDENRFLYSDLQLSKEYVRQHYRRYDPDWVEAVDDAKHEAEERGVADWRPLCEIQPKPLSEELVQLTSDIYRSGCNHYTGDTWFDAPALDDVVERAQDLS